MSNVSEDRVRELAYLLSEKEGFPAGRDKYFWDEAIKWLEVNTWYIRSGELRVSGNGSLNDVLNLAYTKAVDENLSLSTLTSVSTTGFEALGENDFLVNTQFQLERFGLWN